MSMEIATTAARISSVFRRIVDVFLAGEGNPFSQILAAERIERICGQHGCLFGQHGIFSTPVELWAFLSQVLRDGKEAACQAAAASIAAARLERGEEPPTEDTGDCCRARAKLSRQTLKAISCEVAEALMPARGSTSGAGATCDRADGWASATERWPGHVPKPRQNSFTAACQSILSAWMQLSASRTPAVTLRELRHRLPGQIAACEVANRPGRCEPRVMKRRKHRYPLMKQPRAKLRRGIATSKA